MYPGVSARRKIGSLRKKKPTGTGDFKGKIKGEKKTIRKEIQIVEEERASHSSEICIKKLTADFNV